MAPVNRNILKKKSYEREQGDERNFFSIKHLLRNKYSVNSHDIIMPSKKVVQSWGFDCLDFECDRDEVKKIWCKLCKEYSELVEVAHERKGVEKFLSEMFVKRTSVIKRNNFSDHCKKSITHASAMAYLS